MIFFIQASNPNVVSNVEATETDLREAIEDIFELETEDAILNWNGVSIALSYKYDFSVIIDDLVEMLETIQSSSNGNHMVSWSSNTFLATWNLTWDKHLITCTATWNSISGNIEDVLTKTGNISLPVEEFLAEWKKPLERVIAGLKQAGYKPKSLVHLEKMEQLLTRLKHTGRLYSL